MNENLHRHYMCVICIILFIKHYRDTQRCTIFQYTQLHREDKCYNKYNKYKYTEIKCRVVSDTVGSSD
ncbi:hypothetical protein XENTR_v10024579 [Xenopus tropicalis]|nr:hypothetical protein XENTR_v10024579 [Xenopus tropicalis]